jgi:hypothetical protein
MNSDNDKRFSNLGFDDFRRLAQDDSLSRYERIGFPDSYRKGKERHIFEDILGKLPSLEIGKKVVLDIGPGCSELPIMLIEHCRRKGHKLILVDSAEMLSRLPDEPFIQKIAGYYPRCEELFTQFTGAVDVILSYSMLHYVFAESNVWNFLDRSLSLLSHGGEMLMGDVPNISKRKRFFSSPFGIRFHQEFMQSDEQPKVVFNQVEPGQIDDAVILSLVMRARAQGYDAYVEPQRADLPMANRREDILIKRP